MAEELMTLPRQRELPPRFGDEPLPADVSTELQALSLLSDDVLWNVARGRMTASKQRRWQRLLLKEQSQGLTEPEQAELLRLTCDGDRLTLCKAHAYLLLKERGFHIPELERLRRTP